MQMKPIVKVFLVIGTLVLALIVWSVVFNDGGVIRLAWNGLANPINSMYHGIMGNNNRDLLPEWNAGVGTNRDMAGSDANTLDSAHADAVGGGVGGP
jgi:hypothetical protein